MKSEISSRNALYGLNRDKGTGGMSGLIIYSRKDLQVQGVDLLEWYLPEMTNND